MKKKSVASSQKSDEKALTIIVTVLPVKNGKRKMIVSAAPEGEMPVMLTGTFAERHQLMDQAYAAVLRREPQVVTIKEDKKDKRKGGQEEEEPGNREPDEDEEKGDQLVGGNTEALSEKSEVTEEDLPAIEGDDALGGEPSGAPVDAPADAGEVEKFEAQLSDISDADGFPPEARGNDGAEAGDGE